MTIILREFFFTILFTVLILCPQRSNGQVIKNHAVFKNLIGNSVHTDSLNGYLEAQMKVHNVPGISLAIINNGKVVFHTVKGYSDLKKKKKVSPKSIFEGASLSKPLFAHFVMSFVEEGLLDLDRPLYRYMPYTDISRDDRYKKITARMVLSHTTGFPNWRSDYKENTLFIQFEPGTKFSYSGEGYQYLAKVLAHLLHTDDCGLEVEYQKRIANPLLLKNTKFVQDSSTLINKVKGYKNLKNIQGNDDPYEFGAAFSIHSEAKDFSKWVIALLEKKGLSENGFVQLFEPQVTLPQGHPQRQEGITDWTLGFAKAVLPIGTVYGHGGNNPGFTSLFVLQPKNKWGFVIFTNADQSRLPLQLLQYFMK